MSFPASLTTRTVKGRFVTYPDGTPAVGTVRIVLANFMQGPTDDTFVAPFDRIIELDKTGSFSVVLPATNDPQWTSSHYNFTIATKLDPKQTRLGYPEESKVSVLRQRLDVPYDSTADMDVADYFNVPAPTPGQVYLLSAQLGAPNGIAQLDGTGRIPTSQLPASAGGSITWDEIEDKPTSFPAAPTAWTDVTGKPSTFPSTPAWTDVTGKPSVFPPTAHAHATSDVTGLDAALASKATESELTSGLADKANVSHTHSTSDIASLDTALASKATYSDVTAAIANKADLVGGVLPKGQLPSLGKTDVGLGNVDNTSDASKPVSTAQATALALKAPLANPSFTGTVSGVTAAMVGLGNVDNTSDVNKPVSTAQSTALAAKAPINNPTFTGTVGGITAAMVGLGNVDNTSDANKPVSTATQNALAAKAPLASPAFTGTPTAPTPSPGDNSTYLATTAFVEAALAANPKGFLVLGASDTVPGGTPPNTVIIRPAS